MFIPPMGDAAACPTFVRFPGTGEVRLPEEYPPAFAPNGGTAEPGLVGNPAPSGFVLIGAVDEGLAWGKSGFAPEFEVAPGTAILVPVGFVGVWPA